MTVAAEDLSLNPISTILSYQYSEDFSKPPFTQGGGIISGLVSFHYLEDLGTGGLNKGGIISPVASYQYLEWPGDSILQLQSSALVSYIFREATIINSTLKHLLTTPSSVSLAFDIPTEIGQSYVLEYKTELTAAVWTKWAVVIGDGGLKSFFKDIKLAGSWFIRPRRIKSSALHFRFPLAETDGSRPISGYRYGEHWESRYCLDSGNTMNRLLHIGVDFKASAGEKVFAVADGEVKHQRRDETWGGYLVLQYAQSHTVTYTHVIPTVTDGAPVSKGDEIGTVAEGNENFDSHLHLQIRSKPFSNGELPLILVGRLPEDGPCVTSIQNGDERIDPGFPEFYINPEEIVWE